MAILKIGKTISTPGHLHRATDYSCNADKTMVDETGALTRAVDYSLNAEKTMQGELLVTGVNCSADTAAARMLETKRLFGKTDGRQAYHLFLSYEENELSPQLAHEIGVRFTREYFKDFEAVVGTHCNTDNLHNDIVVNSVSFADGHKLHISRKDLFTMRVHVNNLCEEYGISKIPPLKDRNAARVEAFDPTAAFGKRTSHAQQAKEDIELCIKTSYSMGDFYTQMENRGYRFYTRGQNTNIIADGWKNPRRLSSLGYPLDDIQARVDGRKSRPKSYSLPFHVTKPLTFRARQLRHPITRFEALYLRWLYILGKIKKNPGYTRIDPAEYRKFQYYKKQLQFLVKHKLATGQQAGERLAAITTDIKALDIEKFKLLGAQKKHKLLFDAYDTYTRLSPLAHMLSQDEKRTLDGALRLIKQKGYGGKVSAIGAMRESLTAAIATKKAEVNQLKRDCKMLRAIISDAPHIQHAVLAEDEYQRRTTPEKYAAPDVHEQTTKDRAQVEPHAPAPPIAPHRSRPNRGTPTR